MPGPRPGGCLITSLLGIGGAVLAGFLGQKLGWYQRGEGAGFLAAIVGAVLILFVYRLVIAPPLSRTRSAEAARSATCRFAAAPILPPQSERED